MRMGFLLIAVVAVTACAEAVHGPRVVTYSPDRFYVRHVPVVTPSSDVTRLAGIICEQSGREATLEDAQQYAWLDIRYATYRCVEVMPAADPA